VIDFLLYLSPETNTDIAVFAAHTERNALFFRDFSADMLHRNAAGTPAFTALPAYKFLG
jgi:hypothetical protein